MRETWAGRSGFIMATARFAVGLGNIWQFPYMVGENGGGAFLVVYVACSILIGIPLLTAEINLGRKVQLTPIAGMAKLTGNPKGPWNLSAWLGVAASVMILSYYHMILGWVIAYFIRIVTGQFSSASPEQIQSAFDTFVATPVPVLGYTLFVIVLVGVLVARGLRTGVERVAVVAMPLLFLLVLALAVRSPAFAGSARGLAWYLTPDFSALNGETVLAALGRPSSPSGSGCPPPSASGATSNARPVISPATRPSSSPATPASRSWQGW